MKAETVVATIPLEPERYELRAPPTYRFEASRREFFKLLGGGLLIFPRCQKLPRRSQELPNRPSSPELPNDIAGVAAHRRRRRRDRLHRQGRGRPEHPHVAHPGGRGRAARAGDSITMVMADTALTPFDMGTFGSRTTPTWPPSCAKWRRRRASCSWTLAADTLASEPRQPAWWPRQVTHGTQTRIGYAALTQGREAGETMPGTTAPTAPPSWRSPGSPRQGGWARRRDRAASYTSDLERPGMLHGESAARPDCVEATLVSADTSAAQRFPA